MDNQHTGKVIIAEHADLILAANHVQISVSSKEMMKSEVFRAMLGPNFAEGQALHNNDTEDPTTIPLPEDDGQAMIAVNHILHGQEERLGSAHDDSSWIFNLAVVIDKYDCLSLAKRALDRMSLDLAPRRSYNADVLGALYLLNECKRFEQYTRLLIMEVGLEDVGIHDYELSIEIYEAICNRDSVIRKSLFEKIEKAIEPLEAVLKCEPHWSDNITDKGRLRDYLRRVAKNHRLDFTRSKLWPTTCYNKISPIKLLLERMRTFKLSELEDLATLARRPSEEITQLIAFREHLWNMIFASRRSFTGVCLRCLKDSNDSETSCPLCALEKDDEHVEMRDPFSRRLEPLPVPRAKPAMPLVVWIIIVLGLACFHVDTRLSWSR